MEPNKIYSFKHSFENSKRIIEQSCKIDRAISDLLYDGLFDSRKEANKRINDLLYDTATKKEMSLYDLCFKTMPDERVEPNFDPTNPKVEVTVCLRPVEFELEKGPGYWKSKYYNLKRMMQELIDNKEI